MLKGLRSAILVAGLALIPMAASAVTFSSTNTISLNTNSSGALIDYDATRAVLNKSNPIDISNDAAWDFTADFKKGDVARTWEFVFVNNATTARTLDFGITFKEVAAFFSGGGKVSFGPLEGNSFGGSTTDTFNITDYAPPFLTFNPGDMKVLTISFGRLVERVADNGGVASITFGATTPSPLAAVPVPAAGGLLATGLLGLAALRRRRKAA